MADTLQIRGEEVQIRVIENNALIATFTAIESCTWTVLLEILESEFLGETTKRYDEIFKGCGVEFVVQPESTDFLKLIQAIQSRATRRTAQANSRIDLHMAFNFPNLQRPRVTISDLKFGEIPVSIPGRAEYAKVSFNAKASNFVANGV